MKKTLIILIPLVVIIVIGIILLKQPNKQSDSTSKLLPATEITHEHGLGLDPNDPSKLYIATHHGLYVLMNDKDLFAVGENENDYMGFSPHPNKSGVFFASGHPASGGNIGFQKSEDGGFNWKVVSNGVGGPVDFHAMTVSSANPDLVYGWYHGAVQRSTDGGKSWQEFPNKFIVVNFAADPSDENVVYAASPQGLFVSKNKGQDWDVLLAPEKGGFISTVSVDPQNAKNLLVNSEKMGLIRSEDSGVTWTEIKADFGGEAPLYITRSSNTLNLGYLITEKNSIYKTTDGGISWLKVR